MRIKTNGFARKRISNLLAYAVLFALGVLWVLPIAYLIYTAFRESPSTGIINSLVPDNLRMGLGNFKTLFIDTMFPRWLWNTLLVSTCSCAQAICLNRELSYGEKSEIGNGGSIG